MSQKKIDQVLLAATCALLGTSALPTAQAQENKRWDFDTAVLYYGESDGRVQDLSLNALAKRDFDDERFLSLRLSIDSLTGASASGAIALDRPQTFTSPSGRDTYTTPAGEIPLDDTFLDTRVAVSANWSQPFARLYTGSAGISFSSEYDYLHTGINASISRDFNKRNTTVNAGFAFAQDKWDAVGGAPIGLSQMQAVGTQTNKLGQQDKDILDVLLGVTQVINKKMVVQVNYSFSDASGYLNDPYKILSVVDAVSGDTLPIMLPVQGPDGVYLHESRPDTRTKHGLFGRMKYYLSGNVLDLSYRYATDDWDIDSHTMDGRYRIAMANKSYFEPHIRYYSQTEANFYRSSIIGGAPLPEFASADYRLGQFDAMTVGVEYGRTTKSDNEWSVRLEYYMQSGTIPADQIIGNQANREQYPDLNAVIMQYSYKFGL